jgi:hypothetical protein
MVYLGGIPSGQPADLIELYCHDCTQRYRKAGRSVLRVLHRYSLIGEMVKTIPVEETGNDEQVSSTQVGGEGRD